MKSIRGIQVINQLAGEGDTELHLKVMGLMLEQY